MPTVMKVQFENTLRRIYYELGFNIAKLREKICILFGLNLDADFTLTYIDEDGDVVTLCDDNDLDDLEAQSLNPLLMYVTLNPDKHANSSVTSSENSTPVSSTIYDHLPIQSLNSAVSLLLKFLPKHEELMKLLLDGAWANMVGTKFTNIDLNVPDCDVKRSDYVASLHADNFKLRKSVDFETFVDLNSCPFIGMPNLSSDSTVRLCPCGTCIPMKKAYNHSKGLAIHEDISCDGCGECPLTGPRFMSKWKAEFDLCYTCFVKTGHDAADYIRMDFAPTSEESTVCSDKKDTEVTSTKMDQDGEVCEKKSVEVVGADDLFFDAQPHA